MQDSKATDTDAPKQESDDAIYRGVRISLSLVALLGVCAVTLYGYYFWGPFAADRAVWGQFGDYLGGLLNPGIALAALYVLTVAVRLQRSELELTRLEVARTRRLVQQQKEQLAADSAEQQFFRLLENLRNYIDGCRVPVRSGEAHGKPAFHEIARTVQREIDSELGKRNLRNRIDSVDEQTALDILVKSSARLPRNVQIELETYPARIALITAMVQGRSGAALSHVSRARFRAMTYNEIAGAPAEALGYAMLLYGLPHEFSWELFDYVDNEWFFDVLPPLRRELSARREEARELLEEERSTASGHAGATTTEAV